MGGRIMDLAVFEKEPRIFYVATASGGLWKTSNAGVTLSPVFDRENSVSLGAVTVSQSNPDVVWVGTGEGSSRNSTAWGDGVYRSTDGGKTWQHMGLTETRHITTILIDPKNENVVYVGALGRLWGPSEERGVYKTTDGGKTWNRVLYVNELTGVADLVMDPKNPRILLAAMWERLRKPYDWKSGGEGSGLYRSTDAGRSWKKIEKGLPPSPLGRIGLDHYRKDPRILIATVEYTPPRQPQPVAPTTPPEAAAGRAPAAAGQRPPGQAAGGQGGAPRPPQVTTNTEIPNIRFNGGGVFRSKDGGASWEKVNNLNPRPFYFSTPRQDPNDEKRMYVLAVSLHVSEDTGATFRAMRANIHADNHEMWINPANSHHMIIGNDGGVYETHDRGETWRHLNSMALGQFYAVAFDFRKPYWVYGGLQDNGSWGQPTQASRAGLSWWDAVGVGGGDGFHVQVDPNDWSTLYSESQGGAVSRWDLKTGAARSIRPRGADGERLRFNWSTPIVLSPHNSPTVYVGANKLFRSVNRGDSWVAISPDLTTNDPAKQRPGVNSVTPEDTGAERHCTIVTISESPLQPGVIYVGTDDGLVHVTRDGGKSWTNLTANLKGLPANTWCSRVTASKHFPGRVYATFDGHRSNDFKPYVFVSEDYGATWTSLAAGLPDYDCLYVIKEGERNPDLLILGSEMSLRFSLDRGKTWSRYRTGFPTVAVHDVAIHPRDLDLVVGTHGRSIWTVDVSALEQLTSERLASQEPFLAQPKAVLNMGWVPREPWDGDAVASVPNTQPGTTIYYYLPKDVAAEPTVTITPAGGGQGVTVRGPTVREGATLRTQPLGKTAGLHGAVWNGRFGQRVAAPGDYRVVLRVDGKEYVTSVKVELADGVKLD